MSSQARLLGPLLLGGAIAACGNLKRADDPAPPSVTPTEPSAPVTSSPPPTSPDAGSDAAPPEAPPPDFACEKAWMAADVTADCAPRRVTVVDAELAIDVTGISIARTPAGRVGIAYNAELNGISGEMRLAHFLPTSPSFTPQIVKRSTGPFGHAGAVSKLAAVAPDTLLALAHDVDDASQQGDVVVVGLDGGEAPFSAPILVAPAVHRGTALGFATHGDEMVATVLVRSGETATIVTRRRSGGGPFRAGPDVVAGLRPADGPGIGAASLVVDPAGDPFHLVFHYAGDSVAHSTPRYHALAGDSWSYRKTLDNQIPNGYAGFSAQLAVFGNRKVAAYFFHKAGQGTAKTAELRLASWQLADDTPTIEVLAQSIPSPDPLLPRYHVALAVDKFGLLHMAVIVPWDEAGTRGHLEYVRQHRTSDGTVRWLRDTVDPDVLSFESDAWVDLLVEPNGRPHLAWCSGKDLLVRYATRFDR